MGSIGLFDSGIGGLSVLKILRQHFPCESFLYFADNAYKPYGEKTEAQIYKRSHTIIEWMIRQDVKLIVVACHTSSSVLETSVLPVPLITMLTPSLDGVFSRSFTKGLGIIATSLSVSKGTLARYLTQKGFSYPIHARACPELVPLIEGQHWDQATACIRHHVDWVCNQGVDHILYGCTHYPFLDSFLCSDIRPQMIDPAHHVPSLINKALNERKIPSPSLEQGELKLFHTGDLDPLTPHLDRLGWEWKEIKNISFL